MLARGVFPRTGEGELEGGREGELEGGRVDGGGVGGAWRAGRELKGTSSI